MTSRSIVLEATPTSRLPAAPAQQRILGTRVDVLSLAETLHRISQWTSGPHQIVTANTLMLLAAEKDPELRQVIEQAALVVPESKGVQWASQRLSSDATSFIPGIDLMSTLCERAAQTKQTVFLLGAKPGVAEAATTALLNRYLGLQIAGTRDGYFSVDEESGVLSDIRHAAPHYLFVGLTMPHQEKWIARHAEALGVPVMMGVGGSFDVWSGNLKRAPKWMQRAGVEWLYRFAQEPWRWRRMIQLPIFVLKVLRS